MSNQGQETQEPQQSVSSFTPVDSIQSLIDDIKKAGYTAWEQYGGVQTDMPDDVYEQFMKQRGFIREVA